MRKHLSLLLMGTLLGVLIFRFLNFGGTLKVTEQILSGLLGILIGYAVFYSNALLNRWLPWKRYHGLRLLTGIIWDVLLALLLTILAVWVYQNSFGISTVSEGDYSNLSIKLIILLLCLSILYNLIYFALYSYNYYAKGQVMELQLERKQTQLQLNALKSQLSPHFLFNSINSLSALFHKDVVKAESFIRALAKSYHYILENHRTTLVTVSNELDFVEAYKFLVQTRFGNGFDIKVNLSNASMETKIPPMTLQLLVENAVKHNSIDEDRPVMVTIDELDGMLCVKNNKTSKKEQVSSTKIGLGNIKSRYKLLRHEAVKVLDGDDFTVKLPIIP